jgi:hypothetical protein
MARISLLLGALALASGVASTLFSNATDICREIEDRISDGSDVFYPCKFRKPQFPVCPANTAQVIHPLRYTDTTTHWFLSSNDKAACVVEAGSAEDVSLALQTIAASRTPFAVYSGGHASNPGFSSTKGVHISLGRLNQVALSPDKSIVTLGFGQVWMAWVELANDRGLTFNRDGRMCTMLWRIVE